MRLKTKASSFFARRQAAGVLLIAFVGAAACSPATKTATPTASRSPGAPASPSPWTSTPVPSSTTPAYVDLPLVRMAASPRCAGAIQFSIDGNGWVWSGSKLLSTSDRSQSWDDITPRIGASQFGGFCRLDAAHGWISAVVGSDLSSPITVWRTSDGGHFWRSSAPVPSGVIDAGAGLVQFVDTVHGWFMIGHAGMAQAADAFVSRDGGVTWSRGSGPGYYGDLEFVSPSSGWLSFAGAAGGGDGLYRTSNGTNWALATASSLPPPAQDGCGAFYGPVRFLDPAHGLILVALNGSGPCPARRNAEVFETVNGGASWQATGDVILSGPVSPTDLIALTPSAWAVTDYNGEPDYSVGFINWTFDAGRHFTRVAAHGLSGSASNPVFVDSHDGWILAPPEPGGVPGTLGNTTLFHTLDGGQTWLRVPVPN